MLTTFKSNKVLLIQTDIGVEGVVEYALPDEFDIYDMNKDGQIEYEEFVFMLMSLAPMEQPEEMRGPFLDSDIDSKQRNHNVNMSLRDRLRTHKYFTKDQFFILIIIKSP